MLYHLFLLSSVLPVTVLGAGSNALTRPTYPPVFSGESASRVSPSGSGSGLPAPLACPTPTISPVGDYNGILGYCADNYPSGNGGPYAVATTVYSSTTITVNYTSTWTLCNGAPQSASGSSQAVSSARPAASSPKIKSSFTHKTESSSSTSQKSESRSSSTSPIVNSTPTTLQTSHGSSTPQGHPSPSTSSSPHATKTESTTHGIPTFTFPPIPSLTLPPLPTWAPLPTGWPFGQNSPTPGNQGDDPFAALEGLLEDLFPRDPDSARENHQHPRKMKRDNYLSYVSFTNLPSTCQAPYCSSLAALPPATVHQTVTYTATTVTTTAAGPRQTCASDDFCDLSTNGPGPVCRPKPGLYACDDPPTPPQYAVSSCTIGNCAGTCETTIDAAGSYSGTCVNNGNAAFNGGVGQFHGRCSTNSDCGQDELCVFQLAYLGGPACYKINPSCPNTSSTRRLFRQKRRPTLWGH